jgi:predicted tellurium resistance membrane protein TerC
LPSSPGTGFIFLGGALINSFAWIFYLFGVVLLLTAGNMLKSEGEESHTAFSLLEPSQHHRGQTHACHRRRE